MIQKRDILNRGGRGGTDFGKPHYYKIDVIKVNNIVKIKFEIVTLGLW